MKIEQVQSASNQLTKHAPNRMTNTLVTANRMRGSTIVKALLPLGLALLGLAITVTGSISGSVLMAAMGASLGMIFGIWAGWILHRSVAPSIEAPRPIADLQEPGKHGIDSVSKASFDRLAVENDKLRKSAEDLSAAKQEAEAAVMAKGEFLATMSHEIRTPLNGIIPLLDIMFGTPLSQDQRDYLNTAYSSSKQLLSIVDDILDYSKIEAGKLELESVGINLKDLLESVSRLMARNAEKKGLKFSVYLDPNVRLAVRSDPTRLRQVLTNLVSNAIKFTERGAVEIRITKRAESRTHNELMFAIRDTGVGLSEETQAKLFRPFSQADSSTTRTFGGTGLGLMICKRIIDLMGGQIGVRSELGKGSIFYFSVPLLKAVGDVSLPRRDLHGSKAIIISNDAEILRKLAGTLNTLGVHNSTLSVAADVIAKLRSAIAMGPRWAFDFVVLDFASANAVSQQVARTILNEPQFATLSMLGISGGEEVPADIRVIGRYSQVSRLFGEPELRESMSGLLAGESKDAGATQEASIDVLVAQTPSIGDMDHASSKPITGHILLVEDNPVNRQVAQRLLSLIGLSFDAAENGKQGVEKFASGRYQAVLMDCQMPIMDGYFATRNIRKLEEDRHSTRIPIIAMTANAMVGDREKCIASGMDDYMSKPLNRAMMEQILRRWIHAGSITPASAHAVAKTSENQTSIIVPEVISQSSPAAPTPPTNARGQITNATSNPNIANFSVSTSALKKEIIEDLIDVMGSMFNELVSVYLEDAPKNIAALEIAAIAGGSNEGLVAPAHSLKSTSANLGAIKLAEMAKKIEHGARNGSLNDARIQIQEMRHEFGQVEKELRELIKLNA